MKQFYFVAIFLFFAFPAFSVTPLTGASQVGTTNSLRLTWGETDVNLSSPDVSLNRYQVSYGEVGQTPTIIDNIGNTLREYTITGLTIGKTYEVKIIEVIRVQIPPNPFTPPYIDNFNPSAGQTVTMVPGNLPPVARCQNITKSAGSNCTATITASEINNGSTDPENGTLSYSLNSTEPFAIGTHTVTLTVTDGGGLSSTCTATVTVVDDTPPVAQTKDATVFLDGNGATTISLDDVAVGFSDGCGTVTNVAMDRTAFSCGDLGEQNVILTTTDNSGNVGVATAKVTVKDALAPVIFLPNQTYQLAMNGTATLREETIRNGAVDNCGVSKVVASKVTFDKNDIGTNEVLVTVKDASGNMATKTILVTIIDVMPPAAIVKDAIIYLDANGVATLTVSDVDNGSTDNVGVTELALSKTQFNCSDLGDNVVSLFVRDGSGNLSVATPKVTVVDNIPPTVRVKPAVLPLDVSGRAFLNVPMVKELIADNCVIAEVSLSKVEFSVSDIGVEQRVDLLVTDAGGNTTVTALDVSVVDVTAPQVSIQNIVLFADSTRTATLSTNDLDADVVEAAGIDSTYLSQTKFVCEGDTTEYSVTYFAVDSSGNVGADTFTIMLCDTLSSTEAEEIGFIEQPTEITESVPQEAMTITDAENLLTEDLNYDFYTYGPNPTTDGEVTIYFKTRFDKLPKVQLYSSAGRETYLPEPPQKVNNNTLRLQLRSLNPGMYLLNIRRGLQSQTVKVVKR